MRAIFLVLLLACAAEGQEGVSFLGAPRFTPAQRRMAIRAFDGLESPTLSFVWEAFGSDLSFVEMFLALHTTGVKVLEIHLTNETCPRSGRYCTRYDRGHIEARAAAVAAFIEKHKGEALFIVTTGLEDDLSTTRYRARVKLLKRVLPPWVRIGRNPNAQNYDSWGASVIELHGDSPRDLHGRARGAWSNDGADVYLSRARRPACAYITPARLLSGLREAGRHGYYSFAWFQAQGGCTERFIEPRKRRITLFAADIRALNKILREAQKARKNFAKRK